MYFCTKISLTMRSNIFRLLLLLLPTIVLAQETTEPSLIINEVQVANLDQFLDNANCYGSWIELYNPTDTAISVNGMFLTDGVNKTRFVNAHGSVPANGFKTFWFGHYYSEGNYGNNARRQIPYKLDYVIASRDLSRRGNPINCKAIYQRHRRCNDIAKSHSGCRKSYKYCRYNALRRW